MQALYDPSRHEPLSASRWSEGAVKSEIQSICDRIGQSVNADGLWPLHPKDAESYPNSEPKRCLYAGAAGVILALQILARYGYKTANLNHLLSTLYSDYLKKPDVKVEPGLQIGEIGILIPGFLANPQNKDIQSRLQDAMRRTLPLPYYDITSGQTGMMHAALYLFNKTQNTQWQDLYLQGAKSLLKHWTSFDDTGEWHWRSEVFGMSRHYYGACHGIAGNANVLLAGAHLLEKEETNFILNRTVNTLAYAAHHFDGMANWPISTKPNNPKSLVQWCHGAAGIITAMAKTPTTQVEASHKLDRLLEKSGMLVWKAGPLKKGSGLCHGTAGNGYAFLYLFQRWGDPIWLKRARCFAMHAIEQSERDRRDFGQGRYSLWTGDAGLAVYLHHCLHPEQAALPGLELFQ